MKKFLTMLTALGLLSTSAGAGILANNQTTLSSSSIENMGKMAYHWEWTDINLSHSVQTANIGKDFKDSSSSAVGAIATTTQSWSFFQQTNVLFAIGSFGFNNSISSMDLNDLILMVNEGKSNSSVRVWEYDQVLSKQNSVTSQKNHVHLTVTAKYNEKEGTISFTLDSYISAETDGAILPCSTTVEMDYMVFFFFK